MLLITTFFWGGNAVAGKLANGHVSPMLLTLFRWVIASVVLFPFAYPHVKNDWTTIRSNWVYFVLMACFGFTFFNLLLYVALTYTTAINTTIEQAAMPLFIFIINFIIFRKKPLAIQMLGYVLTLIGVLLTVSGGNLARLRNLDLNIGDIIMIVGAFSYSAYSVGLHAKPKVHWISFLYVLMVIAAVVAVPFALYESTTAKFIWPTTFIGWGVVVYAAVFPSVVCQACFIRGNELLGTNNAALFLNLVPIFGVILSVAILGEKFQIVHAVAIGLVLGGIYIAQRLAPKPKKPAL